MPQPLPQTLSRFSRLTVLALLLSPLTAFAQDAEAPASNEPETMKLFEMFFWSSDVLGVIIIWLLLLMSAVCIGFTLMLAFKYRRAIMLPPETYDEVEALLAERKFKDALEFTEEEESYLGKIAHAALSEASNGFSAMERGLEETGDAEAVKVLRPIEYLNVMGNISPMIGLFGTVYGMIRAFQALVSTGGNADPLELAAGISTALVTTFWGLVVAIPALTAYAILRNKIDAQCADGLLMAEDLIAPLKPSGKNKKPAGSGDRPRATPKPE
ncbi:MAG: MotA/TolQ/ExbB proton channel family protein [Planctomycetota bacterium]